MFYMIRKKDEKIVSATAAMSGFFVNGMAVVAIPPSVAIDEEGGTGPEGRLVKSDLLKQKYEGLLEQAPLFTNHHYHRFEGTPIIDDLESRGYGIGEGVAFLEPGGRLQTLPQALSSSFNRASVYWDIYSLERAEKGSARLLTYVPESPEKLRVRVTNNGDSNSLDEVFFREVKAFETSDLEVIIEFENLTDRRIYIESFCVFY